MGQQARFVTGKFEKNVSADFHCSRAVHFLCSSGRRIYHPISIHCTQHTLERRKGTRRWQLYNVTRVSPRETLTFLYRVTAIDATPTRYLTRYVWCTSDLRQPRQQLKTYTQRAIRGDSSCILAAFERHRDPVPVRLRPVQWLCGSPY